ncbi:hypothetical protein ACLOJK_031060 [Asimina triloba]
MWRWELNVLFFWPGFGYDFDGGAWTVLVVVLKSGVAHDSYSRDGDKPMIEEWIGIHDDGTWMAQLEVADRALLMG